MFCRGVLHKPHFHVIELFRRGVLHTPYFHVIECILGMQYAPTKTPPQTPPTYAEWV